jgi:hypothetical protein
MKELVDWLAALDPVFAFLLALPFAVAVAGLCVEARRYARKREPRVRAREPDQARARRSARAPWSSSI